MCILYVRKPLAAKILRFLANFENKFLVKPRCYGKGREVGFASVRSWEAGTRLNSEQRCTVVLFLHVTLTGLKFSKVLFSCLFHRYIKIRAILGLEKNRKQYSRTNGKARLTPWLILAEQRISFVTDGQLQCRLDRDGSRDTI